MIIGACGFGSTGSSVISDYLLEYGDLSVVDSLEFTWVSGVDGLVDLEYHLNHPHDRTTDSIEAISRYRQRAMRSLHYYEKIGGVDSKFLLQSVDSFLEKITQVKWHWHTYNATSFWRDKFNRIIDRVLPRYERCKGKRYDQWPLELVSCTFLPENFYEAAVKHVKELLIALGADFSRNIILDQPFSGNNPQACFPFFEDPYAIVVDRDPRDNYVFANTRLLGVNHFMPVQPVENFVRYYRLLRDNQPYKEENNRVLNIKFEDMVYHYDETTLKIQQFLKLGKNPNPKSIFDPALSIANTQVWKRYPQYANDIRIIEKELPEYLFDYTSCPEPDPNGKMFFGKSPQNRR